MTQEEEARAWTALRTLGTLDPEALRTRDPAVIAKLQEVLEALLALGPASLADAPPEHDWLSLQLSSVVTREGLVAARAGRAATSLLHIQDLHEELQQLVSVADQQARQLLWGAMAAPDPSLADVLSGDVVPTDEQGIVIGEWFHRTLTLRVALDGPEMPARLVLLAESLSALAFGFTRTFPAELIAEPVWRVLRGAMDEPLRGLLALIAGEALHGDIDGVLVLADAPPGGYCRVRRLLPADAVVVEADDAARPALVVTIGGALSVDLLHP